MNTAAPTSSPSEQFLEKNFRKIVWIFILLVLGVVAYGLISHNARVAAELAAEDFTAAKTIEDCDIVIRKHPGTQPAANALLLKASLHWDKNEKTSCVEALKAFTTQFKDHPFRGQTLLAIATKQEAMGDKNDAKASYEQLITEFPASDIAQLAQIRLGDLLWADGKETEAKQAYADATSKFSGITTFQSEIDERLTWIAASLPTKETEPPPAPKPDPKAAAAPGLPGINLDAAKGGVGSSIPLPGAPTPLMLTPPKATTLPTAPPALTPAPAAPAAAPTATSPAVEVPANMPKITPPAAPAPAPAVVPTPAPKPAPAAAPAPAPAAPKPDAAPAPAPAAPKPDTAPTPAPVAPKPDAAPTPAPAAPKPAEAPAPAPKATVPLTPLNPAIPAPAPPAAAQPK